MTNIEERNKQIERHRQIMDGLNPFLKFTRPAPTIEELGLPRLPRHYKKESQKHPSGLVLVTGKYRNLTKAAFINDYLQDWKDSKQVSLLSYDESNDFSYEIPNCELFNFTMQGHVREHWDDEHAWKTIRITPDIFVFGDLDNEFDANVAMHLAASGFLVFASISAISTARAVQKIVQLFKEDEREQARRALAHSMVNVVNALDLETVYHPDLPPVFEVLNSNDSVKANIVSGDFKALYDDIRAGESDGMQSMESAVDKFSEGLRNRGITKEDLPFWFSRDNLVINTERIIERFESL